MVSEILYKEFKQNQTYGTQLERKAFENSLQTNRLYDINTNIYIEHVGFGRVDSIIRLYIVMVFQGSFLAKLKKMDAK